MRHRRPLAPRAPDERAQSVHNLVTACWRGDDISAERIFEKDQIHVDSADDNDVTPLQAAAAGGNLATVRKLVSMGAGVDLSNRAGLTPLAHASRNGHAAIIEFLLKSGADKSLKTYMNSTCLVLAARGGHLEAMRVLIRAGVPVNPTVKPGKNKDIELTPLFSAQIGNSDDGVELLLTKNADPNLALSSLGISPLIFAAMYCKVDIVQLLLDHGADPNSTTPSGKRALDFAVELGRSELVKILKPVTAEKRGGKKALTLVEAIENGDPEAVREAFNNESENIDKISPVDGDTPLIKAVRQGKFDIVKILEECNASLDICDAKRGWSPLMHAISLGNSAISKFLLCKGADVRVKGYRGDTAFDLATSSGHVDPEILTWLAKATTEASKDKHSRSNFEKKKKSWWKRIVKKLRLPSTIKEGQFKNKHKQSEKAAAFNNLDKFGRSWAGPLTTKSHREFGFPNGGGFNDLFMTCDDALLHRKKQSAVYEHEMQQGPFYNSHKDFRYYENFPEQIDESLSSHALRKNRRILRDRRSDLNTTTTGSTTSSEEEYNNKRDYVNMWRDDLVTPDSYGYEGGRLTPIEDDSEGENSLPGILKIGNRMQMRGRNGARGGDQFSTMTIAARNAALMNMTGRPRFSGRISSQNQYSSDFGGSSRQGSSLYSGPSDSGYHPPNNRRLRRKVPVEKVEKYVTFGNSVQLPPQNRGNPQSMGTRRPQSCNFSSSYALNPQLSHNTSSLYKKKANIVAKRCNLSNQGLFDRSTSRNTLERFKRHPFHQAIPGGVVTPRHSSYDDILDDDEDELGMSDIQFPGHPITPTRRAFIKQKERRLSSIAHTPTAQSTPQSGAMSDTPQVEGEPFSRMSRSRITSRCHPRRLNMPNEIDDKDFCKEILTKYGLVHLIENFAHHDLTDREMFISLDEANLVELGISGSDLSTLLKILADERAPIVD